MKPDSIASPSRWSVSQVVLATLFIVSVLIAFWLLYRFRLVLLVLFVAMLLGTGIRPAVNWLGRRGFSRLLAQILIYLLILSAVIVFILLVLPMLLEQSTAITGQISTYYTSFRSTLTSSPSAILREIGFELPPDFQIQALMPAAPETTVEPGGEGSPGVNNVLRAFEFAGIAARVIFMFVAVLLTSFYWTLEGERAIRTLALLAPSRSRENVLSVVAAVEEKLGAFLIGQSILVLVIGCLSLAAYLLIGLPNALILALIAGLMEIVPMVGPVLGAIPAVIVAFSADQTKVLWVIGATVIIQFLENNLLVPRIMDRSVGVHPLLTLLALAAFSSLMGLVGALLAVPIAAIIQYLFSRFILDRFKDQQLMPRGRDYISFLRLKVQEISQDTRKQIGQNENGQGEIDEMQEEARRDLVEEIEVLANELDQILSQAASLEGSES